MAYEQLKDSVLPRSLAAVVADLAELVQKEFQLARAEISHKVADMLAAGIRMAVAAVLGLLAGMLIIQGLVFWIASLGISLHWSCLIVAAVLGVAGAVAGFKGRADARAGLTPTRTIHQVKQDITTIREQLT